MIMLIAGISTLNNNFFYNPNNYYFDSVCLTENFPNAGFGMTVVGIIFGAVSIISVYTPFWKCAGAPDDMLNNTPQSEL